MDESPWWEYPAEVHRAAGIVTVQTNCYVEDAMRMLRDRAAAEHVTLEELAARVLDRRVRFD